MPSHVNGFPAQCVRWELHFREGGENALRRTVAPVPQGVRLYFGTEEGRGGLLGPIILIASAEHTTAKGKDRVGSGDGRVHLGLFQPCADGALAPAFHETGTDAEALGPEVGVVHVAAVLGEAVGAPARRRAGSSIRVQDGEQLGEAVLLEIVVPDADPSLEWDRVVAEERVGHQPAVFLGVPKVDGRQGDRIVFGSDPPDLGGTVAEDRLVRGLGEAAPFGFAPHRLGEG